MKKKIFLTLIGFVFLIVIGIYTNLYLLFFGLNPTLNQLELPEDYKYARSAESGDVVVFGTGKKNLILIPGLGMTWGVYRPFINANKEKYTMYTFNLPGFGTQPVFQKPEGFNDYSKTIYTDKVVQAVSHLISDKEITDPTVVGYFMGGSTAALRTALELPEQIASVVIISGEVRRYRFDETKRKEWINGLAKNFFRYVDRKKWNKGKFEKIQWSDNDVVSEKYYRIDEDDPIAVLIQYTIEANAFDLTYFVDELKVPLLAITPGFKADKDSNEALKLLASSFVNEWEKLAREHDLIATKRIDGAKLAIIDDHTKALSDAISSFLLTD